VGWKRDGRGNIQKCRAGYTFELGCRQGYEEPQLDLSYQSV